MNISKFGDWDVAKLAMQNISRNLCTLFKAQIQEDGELVLKTIVNHIDRQDLNWTPLSEHTVELKGGDSTIYVETGYLRDNLAVSKVQSHSKGLTLFIGASDWKTNQNGIKISDLMVWLEYGTDKIPPRPLIRPSWEYVEPIIKDNWRSILKSLVERGG